jgi:hypothetical protein
LLFDFIPFYYSKDHWEKAMKDTNKNLFFVELTLEEASVIKGGREAESGGQRRRRGRGKDDPVGHH